MPLSALFIVKNFLAYCKAYIAYSLHLKKDGRFHKNITLKPVCDTRWEVNIDSVRAVYSQFVQTCNALEEFIGVNNDNTAVTEAKIQEMPVIL